MDAWYSHLRQQLRAECCWTNTRDPAVLERVSIDSAAIEWYADKASGNDLNRSEFERLQKDILSGTIDCVVVWMLDRLSQHLRDGITTLCDWCECGLRVVSVTKQFDFS